MAPSHRLHVQGSNTTIMGQTDTGISTLLLANGLTGNVKQATVQLNGDNMDFTSIQQNVGFRPFRFNPGEAGTKVSIGTSTTNAALQLSNQLTNRKIILFEAANNDHQFFGLGMNTSTFRFQIDALANRYAWFAGSSTTTSNELMRLDGSGNLSLGLSASALGARLLVGSSGALYDVGGAWTNQWIMVGPSAAANSAGIGLGYNSASNYGCLSCIQPGAAYRDIRYTALNHTFYNGTTALLNLASNGITTIGTQSNTSLAITKSTLGSAAPLTVSSAYYLKIGGTEYRTNSLRLIGLGFQGASFQPAYIGYIEDIQSSNSYGSIIFGTRSVTTDTTPIERMRISSTGYIGIGTTGPVCELDVNGVARAGRGLIVGNSMNNSRKYYSYSARYTKTSSPLQLTLTFGNSSFSANITSMLTNTGTTQDLSVVKVEAIGGASNGATPTMNILSTNYSVRTMTGTSWNSDISQPTTTPTTMVLSASTTTNGGANYNIHIELIGGSLTSITDNDTTPNSITFNY